MENINILALDVATKCGWATDVASGTWDLSVKKDESGGMKLIRFVAKLEELRKGSDIGMVVFERVTGRFVKAVSSQSEMVGALKLWLENHDIPYRAYSPTEIKKFATGKGNAGKPAMVAAAKELFPNVKIVDDNHADALFLLMLAKSEIYAGR